MSERARADRIGVHERLVMPGSGIEILDGKVLSVPGADPPHATRHASLAYVLSAHVAAGYVSALDMLTRTDERSDFAPDASVFPDGRDRETGGRRLEVLAFEVVSSQRLSVATRKARQLSRRGVPRIFALVVAKNHALEWDRGPSSPRGGRWRPMHRDELIHDPSLAVPLPIRALLDTARADEAVLAALEARRPDLVASIEARGRAEGEVIGEARGEAIGEARGRADARREAIADLCAVLGIAVTKPRAARLAAASVDELAAIARALRDHRRWPSH